jgi:diguanylate cyclase (GGDEF)-like protein/PAS domain S-box-containing protein
VDLEPEDDRDPVTTGTGDGVAVTEPAVLLARVRPLWQRATQIVAILALLATTAVVLRVVVHTNALLGRMATDVATTQQRVTNLSNAQREALRLLQEITDLGTGSSLDQVTLRRGLLARQLQITVGRFPPGSDEGAQLIDIRAGLTSFPWAQLADPTAAVTSRSAAKALVSQAEVRLKELYDPQESYFYESTLESVKAKRDSQNALIGLVCVVVVLGISWVVTLKRRGRSDMSRAYNVLVGEMTERRSAEQAVRASEVRFRSLVQRASDLTAVTDGRGAVGYLSPASQQILGYPPDELIGRSLLDCVHADDRPRAMDMLAGLIDEPAATGTIELRMTAPDGRVRMVEALCTNQLADPAVAGIVWNCRDITDRRALQDQLSHQASHDTLTALPNRALLMRRLSAAVRWARETGGSVAALLVDLDGFKNVNDTLGHAAGDELLQRVAERLRGCVLKGDTVARLGGDEFAIALPTGTGEHAAAVSRRVITALHRPISAAGQEVRIGASIGLAQLVDQSSAEQLLSDADIAMYVAKKNGKGRYQVFEQGMRERALQRTRLEQDLAGAVALGRIEVHYQPIVDLATQQVTAVEGLARWRRSSGELVQPSAFIPIAEEGGLIGDIGADVLRQACETVVRWRRTVAGSENLAVAVNVSGWQLLVPGFSLMVADTLARTGLPPEAVTLEITESMLLENSETVAAEIGRLKALNVRLAIDDFGAGYSSLSSMLRFNVDTLKIDRVVLESAVSGQGSLVRAVAELGRALGLSVVAEGVETAEQLALVRAASCDAVQGYLISKPLPEGDAGIFLEWAASTDEISVLLAAATTTAA